MAIWGEASYKVKRAITFRKRFSVAELADATDLSYGQVEQVVQRLIQQGYVRPLEAHELNPAEQAVAGRVGRPRQRYTLTEDPVKREEFYAGVKAIASAERLSRAKERKPSTPYFNRAMQMIEAMERGAEPPSTARLEEAAAFLAYGRDFEGLIPEGVEIVQAYYDSIQARLEALRGKYTVAEEFFGKARKAFQEGGLVEEADKVNERLLCMNIGRQLARAWEDDSHIASVRAVGDALHLVHTADLADRPLLPLLREALEMLLAAFPTSAYEKVTELKGFPASPGTAEGTARVIISADELGTVQPGEILVCSITTPSWAPVFAKIKAAVTDIGGMTSHAAIVSREYGLPAVVGTGFATKIIKTGDRLKVDANEGLVAIEKRNPPAT